MLVHMCRFALMCVLRLPDRGARTRVLSRRPVFPELTCVPINTDVTLLTCSPARSAPLLNNTEAHHWRRRVQEGRSKEADRMRSEP